MTSNGRERNHRRTVEYYRQGTNSRWVACLAASRIVGKYEEGATQALANDLCMSIRNTQRLAQAGITYRDLRRLDTGVQPIRKKLTIKHFWTVGELQRKHDIPPFEVLEQLRTAADEGASVEEMRRAIVGEYSGDNGHIPLPAGEFRVIYADPPWQFDNSGFDQSAAAHYQTMATDEICELEIPAGSHSVLFMWATNAMLEDALQVIDEWGFDYKSNLVWIKEKGPGIGWFVTSRHELLLIATKGDGMHPDFKPLSVITGEVTRHSKKPHSVYELIERMYEGPYLELFARNKRDGWESWGNEI